jgi:hypothetical protein
LRNRARRKRNDRGHQPKDWSGERRENQSEKERQSERGARAKARGARTCFPARCLPRFRARPSLALRLDCREWRQFSPSLVP